MLCFKVGMKIFPIIVVFYSKHEQQCHLVYCRYITATFPLIQLIISLRSLTKQYTKQLLIPKELMLVRHKETKKY